MNALLPLGGGTALVLVAGGWFLLREIDRQDRINRRLKAVRNLAGGAGASVPAATASGSLRLIGQFGSAVARSGFLSGRTIEQLQQTLENGGIRSGNALGIFIGGKVLLMAGLPLVAFLLLGRLGFSGMSLIIGCAASAAVGMLVPDLTLNRIRERHLKRVDLGLPDALDMMVICSEAGLGLEPAIERVAQEIEAAHPAVSQELRLTAHELRVVPDRRIALTAMGGRTGLESLKRLGATLIQTLQFGTPLSQALRTLSSEMRHEMLMRFEERAARLPVLLTMPMILFILPCVFIVVGAPAGLMVARGLSNAP